MISDFRFEDLVLKPLTGREIEILDLISKGYSKEDIAKNLWLQDGTVKNHIANLSEKLNIKWLKKTSAKYVRFTLIWQTYKNEILKFSGFETRENTKNSNPLCNCSAGFQNY